MREGGGLLGAGERRQGLVGAGMREGGGLLGPGERRIRRKRDRLIDRKREEKGGLYIFITINELRERVWGWG
jgi:hypothetical protein